MAITVCRSSEFLPLYVKIISSHSGQLTPGDASRMATTESFPSLITHDEDGGSPVEINCDSLNSAAGTHNA